MPRPQEDIIALSRRSTDERRGRQSLNNQLGYAYQAVITTRNGNISDPDGRIYVRRLGGYRDGELGVENPPFPVLPPNGNNVILRAGRLVNIAKNAKGQDYIKNNDQDDLIAANINPRQTNYSDPSAKYKTFEHLTNFNSFAEGGTSNVQVMPGIYRKTDGTFGTFAGDGTYDILTSFKPATSDTRVVVCLWLDPSDGSLTATGSSEFSQNTDIKTDPATGLTYINECVASAPDGAIGLWSWIVNSDDTAISVTNKYRDLRGIVAGGGVSLDDLLDTDITSPSSGDGFIYDGSNWANRAISLEDIAEIGGTVTPTNTGVIFISDGTNFKNRLLIMNDLNGFNTSSLSFRDVLIVGGSGQVINRALETDDIQSGTLAHERGGLEADVSSYGGIPLISGGGTSEIKYNLTATSDPGASDDSSSGYAVGSLWVRTDRDRVWQCVDDTTSAAVWKLIAGTYGVVLSKSTGQIIADLSTDKIAFDGTFGADPDGLFDDANDQIEVGISGTYFITLRTFVVYSGVANCRGRVEASNGRQFNMRFDATGAFSITLTSQVTLSAGDTIQADVFYNNNTNNSNNGTISGVQTKLSAFLVSR